MILVVTCALLGLILIYFEFFLPGAIMGISGGMLLIASIFVLIFLLKPSPLILIAYISLIIFSVFLAVKVALTTVKRKSEKNIFYLDKNQQGFIASMHQKELYGKVGVAASDLKPAGHIKIGEEYYQAVSKSGYIKKDEKVLVESGEGARLIVKKID